MFSYFITAWLISEPAYPRFRFQPPPQRLFMATVVGHLTKFSGHLHLGPLQARSWIIVVALITLENSVRIVAN